MNNFLLPAITLWQRELIRFWRTKSRVIGVVASPLVFWLLIGYGSGDLGRFYSGPWSLRSCSPRFSRRYPLSRTGERAFFSRCWFRRRRGPLGIWEDSRRGDSGLDPRSSVSLVRSARRSLGLSTTTSVGYSRDLPDCIYIDGHGIRDRLANGDHFRLPRHHEPAPCPHVDGVGRAVSNEHGARMDKGSDVD